jgi:regulator of protease activity HflC (stomatin/prohibitin superfamily)
MVTGTLFLSGCEGINPVADMAKIQAENAKSQRDAETQVKVAEIDSQTAIKLAELEAQKEADKLAAEKLKQNAARNPNGSGTITVGSETLENTASVNTGADQSSVGSTSDNQQLAK